MRRFVLALLVCGVVHASIKDEKDLLQGVEHVLGEPLMTMAIVRDPFSWPSAIRKALRKQVVVRKQPPALGWSLTGVSATKRGLYALIDDGKHAKLARVDESLGNGWTVATISEQGMVCKHSSGCTRQLRV